MLFFFNLCNPLYPSWIRPSIPPSTIGYGEKKYRIIIDSLVNFSLHFKVICLVLSSQDLTERFLLFWWKSLCILHLCIASVFNGIFDKSVLSKWREKHERHRRNPLTCGLEMDFCECPCRWQLPILPGNVRGRTVKANVHL